MILGFATHALYMSVHVTCLGWKLLTWFSDERIVLCLANSMLVLISCHIRLPAGMRFSLNAMLFVVFG